jgi:hypothetical protein
VLQPVCVWGGEEEGRGVPGGSVRVRVRVRVHDVCGYGCGGGVQ